MHMQRYMFVGVCLCVECMYCVSVCETKRERKAGMCVCARVFLYLFLFDLKALKDLKQSRSYISDSNRKISQKKE